MAFKPESIVPVKAAHQFHAGVAAMGMKTRVFVLGIVLATISSPSISSIAAPPAGKREAGLAYYQLQCTLAAISDLTATFKERYPKGRLWLEQLRKLAAEVKEGNRAAIERFQQIRSQALLANPLLTELDGVLVVKRGYRGPNGTKTATPSLRNAGLDLGFPSNHECNWSLPKLGYDNEIAILRPVSPRGTLQTLFRPDDGGYVGELDLHWDGNRLLFTKSDAQSWKIWEINVDGTGLRQVSKLPPDVDAFDACYLPDGRIVFGSTAPYQAVPCWHGQKMVANLYVMDADGSNVRQICFDQDHDFHPCVLPNGQVIYHRWDYTGINHIFMRQLMVMNPDGTGQRAIYGSNSWFPNSLYFPRPVPGTENRLIAILSGYHGVHRMGQLVLLDVSKGWYEAQGIALRISGRGDPVQRIIRDNLVDRDWPKFLHPFPLSDKYFLVACWPAPNRTWGIYLADVFDNVVLLKEEPGCALLEPIPIKARPKPPVLPSKIDLGRSDALVYLHDIYAGPGLRGVPRGTIKRLRLLAYHFGYPGLAGPDKIGWGGPWEVMRILGTVPVKEDGSAFFRVPACTPIAVQALDAEGKAVQLMRSWFSAQPGEFVSCVGCHETPADAAKARFAIAAFAEPDEIEPFYGPPRGFDFAREVQPVLDKYCVSCHNGTQAVPDLRGEEYHPEYRGRPLSKLAISRLHPKMLHDTGGYVRYTPAYEALVRYVRRVGIEDDVSLLVPGEYYADTSPFVQLLQKGHGGVILDQEAWDRIVTWIDLNAPCHGTWHEVYPIPDGAHKRRMELRTLFGGPTEDPEQIPLLPPYDSTPIKPNPISEPPTPKLESWPWSAEHAQAMQRGNSRWHVQLEIDEGVFLEMAYIPSGRFIMGDANGMPDEKPPCVVEIKKPFWISTCEITNRQYRLFDPAHSSRYYQKRHAASDDQGLTLDGPDQPVVRVSWQEAMDYCRWLSMRTGLRFTLPTEAQWEYACRAGSAAPWHYGDSDVNFSNWANLGDWSFANKYKPQITGGLEHLLREGELLADQRFDDGHVVTAPVGSFQPNAWGLYDMHGNVAEWTRSTYAPYPYREDDGRNQPVPSGRKVVRGGSFFDPPKWARSGHRLAYHWWQKVFNVGFRVVCEDDLTAAITSQ